MVSRSASRMYITRKILSQVRMYCNSLYRQRNLPPSLAPSKMPSQSPSHSSPFKAVSHTSFSKCLSVSQCVSLCLNVSQFLSFSCSDKNWSNRMFNRMLAILAFVSSFSSSSRVRFQVVDVDEVISPARITLTSSTANLWLFLSRSVNSSTSFMNSGYFLPR